MLLQNALDRFVRAEMANDAGRGRIAEECMEHLADYLLHYSDLFQDDLLEADESPLADWEQALDAHMGELMEGDVEAMVELHGLELDQLEPGHMRDFFGWHLLREMSGDATVIEEYVRVMRQWLKFLAGKGKISHERFLEFMVVLNELAPECERAARAARLLFHFVRLGSGISPRLRGKRFSRFVEGHARIAKVERNRIHLSFDSQEARIGPVSLTREIAGLLKPGDVLDVELGLRADVWLMVDIGPVYPASVYVEAEEFKPPYKES